MTYCTGPGSYVEAASTGLKREDELTFCTESESDIITTLTEGIQSELCPYAAATGLCQFGDRCHYLHGDICDLCHKAVLHPTDEKQREQHQKVCTLMCPEVFKKKHTHTRIISIYCPSSEVHI